MAVDTGRRLGVAHAARRGPDTDCATRRPLGDAASQRVPIGFVVAEAECESERTPHHLRAIIGAQRSIPATRGKGDWRSTGIRAERRQHFPSQCYRQRALAESLFSSVKRQLSARAPGPSTCTPRMQALLLGLAYEMYRLSAC